MVGAPLRIVYFGTPAFAVPSLRALLASRHTVAAVVSQPDRPVGRGQRVRPTPTAEVAAAANVPVLQPASIRTEEFLSTLSALTPDLGVVAAYGRILPAPLLELPRLGLINVHASLLPRWRGAAPVHRAVMAGDTETGVTIMRVVPELDAGATLATARRPIGADETSVEVERDLAAMGAELLLESVEALAAGTAVETPQDEAGVTYAPKLTKDEGTVDWHEPAVAIHNRVRGLQPWPLVRVSLGGVRVLLHRTTVGGETGAAPGTIGTAAGDRLEIAAGDGRVVRLLEIQPEGRRVMDARAFLAGRRLEPGSPIGPP
jgi:methionyl-tRNA formyltransferase